MSVSSKHQQYCRYLLSERGDFSPREINQFIENAYEEYRECPYCGEKTVYYCSSKKLSLTDGQRLGMFIASGGASIFFNGPKFYLCYNCTHSGPDWY